MESIRWKRGRTIGRGAEGIVTLATTEDNFPVDIPSTIAVKSSLFSRSKSLQKEREFLNEFQDCSQIIRCFGADVTEEDGNILYNILLEYAIGGSLAHRIGNKGLPDFEVKKYSKSILKGLSVVHARGFVHLDIKPHNVLLVGTEKTAKIADFGFARKVGIDNQKRKLRGTPMYMAPESVLDGEYGTAVDIWAFGCTVYEMITGNKVWDCTGIKDTLHLLCKIGIQSPDLRDDEKLSKEAQDFLKKCLARDPRSRWTADMLLNHPFLSVYNNQERKRKELTAILLTNIVNPAVMDDSYNSAVLKPMKLLNKRRRQLVQGH